MNAKQFSSWRSEANVHVSIVNICPYTTPIIVFIFSYEIELRGIYMKKTVFPKTYRKWKEPKINSPHNRVKLDGFIFSWLKNNIKSEAHTRQFSKQLSKELFIKYSYRPVLHYTVPSCLGRIYLFIPQTKDLLPILFSFLYSVSHLYISLFFTSINSTPLFETNNERYEFLKNKMKNEISVLCYVVRLF